MNPERDDGEPTGMGHRFVMVRMQSAMDAHFHFRRRAPLGEAIRSTVARMRELFGPDVPREIVEVSVTVHYCRERGERDLEKEP